MSMPQIPEEKFRPTLCEVIIDILKSIALEETALAHILNAEGERCQAVIKKYECCDNPSFAELDESIRQAEKMLNTIIMKEWLLLRKMETAYEINQKMRCKDNDCKPADCCDCNCRCDTADCKPTGCCDGNCRCDTADCKPAGCCDGNCRCDTADCKPAGCAECETNIYKHTRNCRK